MLPGRVKSLREHVYYSNQTGSEATRVMTFDASARTDGLAKREETPVLMIEYFEGRDDCLERRVVHYTKRVKKFGPAEGNEKPITVSPGLQKGRGYIHMHVVLSFAETSQNTHSFDKIMSKTSRAVTFILGSKLRQALCVVKIKHFLSFAMVTA